MFIATKRQYHSNFISRYTKSTSITTINNQLLYQYPLQSSLFYQKIGNNNDDTTRLYSTSSTTSETNDSPIINHDTIKTEQRNLPISEEKHVKTVLFVECGTFRICFVFFR
jgi:hypothetical protein